MKRTIIYFFLIFLFSGCAKTEFTEQSPSALKIIGNNIDVQLMELLPMKDGGFLVGGQTRIHGHTEIWVVKFDQNLNLVWERTMGSNVDNKFFKLHVNRMDEILVAGQSYSLGQDTLPLVVHKFWNPYFHLLQPSGETIWESEVSVNTAAGLGSGLFERISDILEDDKGYYWIGGEFFRSSGIQSTMFKLDNTGTFVDIFDFSRNPLGWVDALFEIPDYVGVFSYWQDSVDATPLANLCFVRNLVQLPVRCAFNRDFEWPWGKKYENDKVAGLKYAPPGANPTFNYIFKDHVYRYEFDLNSENLSGRFLELPFQNVISANITALGNFLMADNAGLIFETDGNFKLLKQFKTSWKPKLLCQLQNGEYIFSTQVGTTMYLVHYSKDGKPQENE